MSSQHLVNARNTTPGNLHRSQPIYGRVGFQGQLNNPNSDTPPAIGTGPAAPFGPTPSFGRGGLPGSRGISLSAYPTLPALPIRTVPAVPSEKQPADDAIGQIQSESSLFLTGGMIARSMPPRVGSAAQRVSIPLRAAPPSGGVSVGRASGLPTTAPAGNAVSRSSTVGRLPVHLLRGPGVDIVVGTAPGPLSQHGSRETWSLSKALICHYSPTLEAACNRDGHDNDRIRILLPEDDPHVFELFVEWTMCGEYTTDAATLGSKNPGVSIDAQAWVLGDSLRSTAFKNYAMGRLYDRYATNFAPTPITPIDVRYAFANSSANAKIRQIFLDLLALHFKDPRVQGDIKEWDAVMQEHAEVRMRMLLQMRSSPAAQNPGLQKQTYMTVDEPHVAMPANSGQIIPAKRTANGVAVKVERTGA